MNSFHTLPADVGFRMPALRESSQARPIPPPAARGYGRFFLLGARAGVQFTQPVHNRRANNFRNRDSTVGGNPPDPPDQVRGEPNVKGCIRLCFVHGVKCSTSLYNRQAVFLSLLPPI